MKVRSGRRFTTQRHGKATNQLAGCQHATKARFCSGSSYGGLTPQAASEAQMSKIDISTEQVPRCVIPLQDRAGLPRYSCSMRLGMDAPCHGFSFSYPVVAQPHSKLFGSAFPSLPAWTAHGLSPVEPGILVHRRGICGAEQASREKHRFHPVPGWTAALMDAFTLPLAWLRGSAPHPLLPSPGSPPPPNQARRRHLLYF